VTVTTIYRAASRRVRINFWLTVLLLLNVFAIPLIARAAGDNVAHEWTEPTTVLAIFGVLVSAGIVLGEFRTVKAELESRARKDVVEQQFHHVMAEVRAVRDLVQSALERQR
jgi:hypothetical protein